MPNNDKRASLTTAMNKTKTLANYYTLNPRKNEAGGNNTFSGKFYSERVIGQVFLRDVSTLTPSTNSGSSTNPEPPTDVSAVEGNAEATVSFTPPANNGGSAIILYTVTSSPDGFSASGSSSPIVVPYLLNNTAYTFTVVATNSVGSSTASSASNSITTTTPSSSAPTITGINTLTTSLILTFTPPTSFGTITNYEYSLDGITFSALSPADVTSPITIPSLTSSTAYSVAIRAINNVPQTGDTSNIVPVTTATNQITETFSTATATTWTAPANVRYVQYLCVGGGGGGGATYSKINVLGAVPVQSTPASGYWIYNGTTNATYTYARMYNGTNTNTSGGASSFTEPIRLTASADTNVPPGGNDQTRWHGNKEVIYYLKTPTGSPMVSNFGYGSYFISTNNNLPSGGSGGGSAGQIRANFSATDFYSVVPRRSYTVIVGDGGAGGIGGPESETAGIKGGDSTFDTIVSEGGSGGQPSRVLTQNSDGYKNGGRGGQNGSTLIREGQGGDGAGGPGDQSNVNVGGYGGAGAGVGQNFSGAYSFGGSGGKPNTVATGVTTPNIGRGGSGTGATLNSFASGIKGGTGVVIIKYYI